MLTTIRGRIILMAAVSLFFVSVLAGLYWWTIASVRNKLYLSQRFEDLFNDILEVRRFEKNFFLYGDTKSLEESLSYLTKTEKLFRRLERDIERVVGDAAYSAFVQDFRTYRKLAEGFVHGRRLKDEDAADTLRRLGKRLVDFSKSLLELKRERIHKAFMQTYTIPVAFVCIFFFAFISVFQFVSTRLLKPLKTIEDTAERVGRGDFRPIDWEYEGDDEICRLIRAFNHMAEELEKNQEALIQSRKIAAIGTFTAGIAHELNNPLNNIYLTAEMLLEDYASSMDAEGKELVLDILNQADRAADIVKSLLDFSRTDRPSFEVLEIDKVISQTLKLVKNQLVLTGTQLEIHNDAPAAKIQGNRRNLEQVFLNLFLNAIQAMPQGGWIRIRLSEVDHDMIRIDVADTGKGIRPEDLEHIFEPFYTTKGVGRGTGLGLSVTYALIKKHGGHIEVQSELGKGTTFSIFLPKVSEDDVEVGEEEPSSGGDRR